SSSSGPAVFGQSLTFTATLGVVAPGAGAATGTVTFAIDGVAQASVSVNSGHATLTTAALSVGNHQIAVTYNGDGNFNTSTVHLVQAVNKAGTSTVVTSSANP